MNERICKSNDKYGFNVFEKTRLYVQNNNVKKIVSNSNKDQLTKILSHESKTYFIHEYIICGQYIFGLL